ncbi:hypothetical protein FM121_00380 [Vagococcus fluvialis bH819]|uniref:Uncharacterized protein n=1 Tax=Vagococcus fluvialis bH819 TaxID=1255619 RepID=A0A1X6WJT4_9ENTE|nr:hypothetical protein FM121_00380 [Vagococcus fluvialis bH819]
MLEQAKVAGTVILNQEGGHKKFLVKKISDQVELVMTDIDSEYTSLACILNEFRDEVHLNTKDMDLVELTNVNIGSSNVPLFVFSLEEKDNFNLDTDLFFWEEPAILREILQKFQISGVPYLT